MIASAKKFRWPFDAGLLASFAILLAACGQEDNATTQGASSSGSAPGKTAAGVTIPVYAEPISPGGAAWGTTDPCTTATDDFVTLSRATNLHPLAPLISRHVGCAQIISDARDVYVNVVAKADGSGWEFFRRGTAAGRSPMRISAGQITLKTEWQVYGPSNVLSKTFGIKTWAGSWKWDPGFPAELRSTLTIDIFPKIDCQPDGSWPGITPKPCSFSAPSMDPISVGSGGAPAETRRFSISFNWDFEPASGDQSARFDTATFVVTPREFAYQVREADLDSGEERLTLPISGESANFAPKIRCDRGLVGNLQGGGCVMPAAAAVFVMDASASDPASEAAQHVLEAQNLLQAGMTGLSPGVYKSYPGTRAVADTIFEAPYTPVYYTRNANWNTANRNAACDLSDSLKVTRPASHSASCLAKNDAGCSCDEYPFASTTAGAAFSPLSTSVRMINEEQNKRGGSQWFSFLQRERILPEDVTTTAPDPVWVFVKPASIDW